MSDITQMKKWILKDSPRGEDLPITCTYRFSYGKRTAEQKDLPEGFEFAIGPEVYAEAAAAGFHSMAKIADQIARELGQRADFLYLRNPEGEIVATWDEGRWWTPEESKSWDLMLQVPAAVEASRFGLGSTT